MMTRVVGLALAAALAGCGAAPTGARLTSARSTTPAARPAATTGAVAPSVTLTTNAPSVTLLKGAQLNDALPQTAIANAGAPLGVPAQPTRKLSDTATGNEAVLSVSPAETLPAVKAFIDGAQHTLWIEMFEFGGTYGQKIIPNVLARAKAGVNVRLLLDDMGSDNEEKGIKPWAAQLKAAGVEILFYPARLRSDGHGSLRFNITHRKLMLADGEVAMCGGTNFGTKFDTVEEDMMIRWRGPVVGDLYREFGSEWNFVGGGKPLPIPSGPFAPAGDVDGRVLVTSTYEGRFEIRDAVYQQIDLAKQDITLANQYLWDDTLVDKLLAALKRGVHVRAMVPGPTALNYPLGNLNNDAMHQLQQAGAETRIFCLPADPDANLHTKFFCIDNKWAAGGSANGDARSFMDHQELDVVTTEPGFVAQMRERIFERDWNDQSKPFVYDPGSILTAPFEGVLDMASYLM